MDTAYKAVIFDLDGTLANSLESIAHCANMALNAFGFNSFELQRYKNFVGDGADTLIMRCLKAAGDEKLEYFKRVYEKYKELFKTGCLYNVKAYDGIEELLNNLKQSKIKTAVLSNKPHERTVDVVNSLFGNELIDIVLGHSEDREKKPSAQGARLIADKLGVSVSQCVYAGDTNVDMLTGKNAEMLTVGVLWGFRQKDELIKNGADIIVSEPSEIYDIILGVRA